MELSELEKLVKEGYFKNEVRDGEIVLKKAGDDIFYIGKITKTDGKFYFEGIRALMKYTVRGEEGNEERAEWVYPGQTLHGGLRKNYIHLFSKICEN
ncbi:MAG: hypothetical protein WC475_04200 [Candidatus Paceibacterota bacterium]